MLPTFFEQETERAENFGCESCPEQEDNQILKIVLTVSDIMNTSEERFAITCNRVI